MGPTFLFFVVLESAAQSYQHQRCEFNEPKSSFSNSTLALKGIIGQLRENRNPAIFDVLLYGRLEDLDWWKIVVICGSNSGCICNPF